MIKAKHFQQQPPNPVTCDFCGVSFNNKKRYKDHELAQTGKCHEYKEWLSYSG